MKKEKNDPEKQENAQLKAEIKALRGRLMAQQQEFRAKGLPILVLVEGWSAAGKGSLINELISEIDPRNYNVFSPVLTPESEARYPFLYPYAKAIPENGKIMFYDSGWMEDCVRRDLRREITRDEYKNRVRAVCEFERQLRDGGYLVLKFFLNISQQEQRKRMNALRENYETEWRVTSEDLWQQNEYKLFKEGYDAFMEKTGKVIPWHVLDGSKRSLAARDALKLLVEQIDKALEEGRYVGKPFKESFPLLKMPKLAEVDLSPALTDEEYRKELKKLQKRLGELHNVVYRKKIPVILCYEGWDAAGKGGNIRRIARPLDPRGFDVMPIASPEPARLRRDAHRLARAARARPPVPLALLDQTPPQRPLLHLRPHLVRPGHGGAARGLLLRGRLEARLQRDQRVRAPAHRLGRRGAEVLDPHRSGHPARPLQRPPEHPRKAVEADRGGLAQPREVAAVRGGRRRDAAEDQHQERPLVHHRIQRQKIRPHQDPEDRDRGAGESLRGSAFIR